MQKTAFSYWSAWLRRRYITKTLMVMKLTSFFLLIGLLQVSARGVSQTITYNGANVPLETVFEQVEHQGRYYFLYDATDLRGLNPVTITATNMPIEDFLKNLLRNQPLGYKIRQNNIVVSRKSDGDKSEREPHLSADNFPLPPVTGIVRSANEHPLSGVSVNIKGKNTGTTTDEKGSFTIKAEKGDVLLFSMIGYKTQEVKVNGSREIDIVLEMSVYNLESVVVQTGIVERRKESFTGATVTITGDELRQIGNQNLVQSLKTLDPSFVIIQNNQLGSNPNQLPAIELRGKSSLTQTELRNQFGGDPNQPLFILDGFESDLRAILDLDINRVDKVTILKDASSTALYGSRAANGVVVVKTKLPERGKMQVSYTADFRLEVPDLHDYNLMNAAEKLEFERQAGRYTDPYVAQTYHYQPIYDTIYNQRLLNVKRGINTDWMNIPLRNGFTNGHSLYAGGGDQIMRYGVGINYRKADGVMKGSGRQTWGTTLDLIYNKGKFSIANKVYISGYTADESPYGAFSLYSRANPYDAPYDEAGQLKRLLETAPSAEVTGFGNVANPLYNALLNNRNHETRLDLQNNLQLIWMPGQGLQLQGALQLRKGTDKVVQFSPPESTDFDGADPYQKGSYSASQADDFSYRANLMLTYARTFAQRHIVTANVRGDIESAKNESLLVSAVGFPLGSTGNPSFAFSYQPNSRPTASASVVRRNNVLASVNYSYDQRYLLDLTWRMDGSTAFGSAKKYSPFMSAGIGWNLHREHFFHSRVVNVLRLRGSIGRTGNQNFGSTSSTSVYSYDRNTNLLGQGVQLTTFGNSKLEWQSTVETNVGTDLVMFGNRLSATVDVYRKLSDPLVVILDMPASTGIVGYPTNVGTMKVQGVEANLRYTAIKQKNNGLIWNITLMGSIVRSKFGGFGNRLEALNEKQLQNSSLVRYADGRSPDDIWAVRSAGIDPATGRELFIRADGKYTFTYDPADITAVGNARPFAEGVFGNNFSFHNFLLGISLRYQFGADIFNDALYNKVENISALNVGYNQDKRALYERWKKPGDIARFKSISLTDQTPMSSRFVQKDNVISGESITLGYQVSSNAFTRKLGIQSLRFNIFMNDIFRLSSVRTERGIDYPFANAVASSLNISF